MVCRHGRRLALRWLVVGLGVVGWGGLAGELAAQVVSYDLVYVRQPRFGDDTNTLWPEVFHPGRAEPGADLVLLHPDGSEEVLVACSVAAGGDGRCAVTDPFVSFDGQSVYYSLFHDQVAINEQRGLAYEGADVFRIHIPTRQIVRLTHGEFTPNTGSGVWDETNPVDPPAGFNRLGYGILNLGPCPLPGGKIAFTSNRNGFLPVPGFTSPALQLYVMDEDGANVTPIAPMTLSSALHPTVLRDGRLMYSSYEAQGLRDVRLWGIWAIQPDGREWSPVVSAFRQPQAFHFMTQMGDEDLVVVDYYNLNNNGFGALYRFPVRPPAGQSAFHSAFPADNPEILQTIGGGFLWPFRMPFTPRGMASITPMTHGEDHAAPIGPDGLTRVGKFTHPSAAPAGDLLVAWTPGPANDLDRPSPVPYYDSGLYLVPDGAEVWSPAELVLIKNDPAFNEAWPRALVPYAAVHGVPVPAELPWLPNDGTLRAELPPGTPYGLVGSSSLYKRESFPSRGAVAFDGLDPFNTAENEASSNWEAQGADAGKYTNADVWAIRVVGLEPNSHRSYGPHEGTHFFNHVNERHRVLGEIPVRKVDGQGNPVLDPEGNPDTSFLVKLPADTPFTFQTLDRNGMVLNMAQTWHQVRPGEVRTNCGGCHAHSQQPLDFAETAAAQPGHQVYDLSKVTPLVAHDASGQPTVDLRQQPLVDVEFYRDVRPLLQRSCAGCHTAANPTPPGRLVLDQTTLVDNPWPTPDLPGDYMRLCFDRDAEWGHPPVIPNRTWRQNNASRYVRLFQSRRSLLAWKVFGARLDGWTNADHPTETVPGNASTLPAGASPNAADLDFTGTIMPPPGSGVPALSAAEKITIARWIDFGCPIDTGQQHGSGAHGWFQDDLRPTLTVSSPRPGLNGDPVTTLRLGAADANSGLDVETLSLRLDVPAAGRPANAELQDLLVPEADGVWVLHLPQALPPRARMNLDAEVSDNQGNVTRVRVTFGTLDVAIFSDGFESGTTSAWSARVP